MYGIALLLTPDGSNRDGCFLFSLGFDHISDFQAATVALSLCGSVLLLCYIATEYEYFGALSSRPTHGGNPQT